MRRGSPDAPTMRDEAAARPRRGMAGRARLVLALGALVLLALGTKAWRDTMADPVVHRAAVTLPQLAPGTAPVRIAHLSQVDTFVTDRCSLESIRTICRDADVRLIETSPDAA